MGKKDQLSTESYKGVRDFYPEDQALLNYLTGTMRAVAERFGYAEYHASILEPAELYKAKGAENAEMANEQTYTFTDRGGREVTLRPEMTPTVARMVAAKRRELGFPLRLYSIPNLFRYERPQRGRVREHWQLNVDLFGSSALAADAEVISIAHRLLMSFVAREEDFVIKIGSRTFLDGLAQKLGLSEQRAKTLRLILDKKDKMPSEDFEREMRALGVSPDMLEASNPPADVAQVLELLGGIGITNAVFDPSVVRGFDYYTGIVFEVFDTHPENNRSMAGGGRYDNLLELFGEQGVPVVGFGMGDATLGEFLRVHNLVPAYVSPTKVYIALAAPEVTRDALFLAEELRARGVCVANDFGERKLAEQIKTAVKHKIPFLIVVGQDEIASGTFAVRNLETGSEETLGREQLPEFFLAL